MKKVSITYAQNTPAYATTELEVPDDASDERIIEAAKAHADHVGDLVFDPSFDWEGLRILDIYERDGKCVARDIPIDQPSSDTEMSRVARGVLTGAVAFSELRSQARRDGCLPADVAGAAVGAKFDVAVEAVRAWDEHGHDYDPARTCVILQGVDDVLLERIAAVQHLARIGGLAEAAITVPSIWGDGIGREVSSKLVVSGQGAVCVEAENDRGVYQSLTFWAEDLRRAWLDGVAAGGCAQRRGDLVLAGDVQSMDWLERMGAKVRELWRMELELAALGFTMVESQSDLWQCLGPEAAGAPLEALDEESAGDTSLPQRVRELAGQWTALRRGRAQVEPQQDSRGDRQRG